MSVVVEEGFFLAVEEEESQRDLRWLLEEDDGCFGGFGPAILGNLVGCLGFCSIRLCFLVHLGEQKSNKLFEDVLCEPTEGFLFPTFFFSLKI